VDILVVHLFNALLYASVLFLIAGGLSLIYGVMRIVNLAHGNLFAIGAFATASAVGQWFAGSTSGWLFLLLPTGAILAAFIGAVLEPTLLRPLYKRPEEYQLLVTFGLLMILEDVMRFVWGPYPVSASVLFEKLGSLHVGEFVYPRYNLLVIAVGGLAALFSVIYLGGRVLRPRTVRARLRAGILAAILLIVLAALDVYLAVAQLTV